MVKRDARILLGVVLLAAGCGSTGTTADAGHGGAGGGTNTDGGKGGAGGAGVCSPIIAGDGVMTWDANGVAECGTITIAGRMTSTQDFIEIIGSTTTGIGVGITVVTYTSTLGGTYTCKNDAGAGSVYVGFVYPGTVEDCTITITNPGMPGGTHATGSFSATVTAKGGGTIEVTNGVFDTPVMLIGG